MHLKISIQYEKILVQLSNIIRNKKAQTSAEMILLIGSILTISLLIGSYIYNINNSIKTEFNQIIEKGRNYLINKI